MIEEYAAALTTALIGGLFCGFLLLVDRGVRALQKRRKEKTGRGLARRTRIIFVSIFWWFVALSIYSFLATLRDYEWHTPPMFWLAFFTPIIVFFLGRASLRWINKAEN